MTRAHVHEFADAGEAMSIKVIPSRCACGATRLDLAHPITGHRTGLALPLDVVRTAAIARKVLAGGGDIYRIGVDVLETLRRLGVVRGGVR